MKRTVSIFVPVGIAFISLFLGLIVDGPCLAQPNLWSWGWNYNGQLGDGTSPFDRYAPAPVVGSDGTGMLTGVIAVAGGYGHSLALKSNGTVWAWGLNANGQIGDGTTLNRLTPQQVVGRGGIGFLTNVTAIASGGYHCTALKSNGTVWAWGTGSSGQLGYGLLVSSTTPVQVKGPGGIGFLTDIVAIAAGGAHNLALKSDGTLRAWGNNYSSTLGDGTITDRPYPVPVLGPQGDGFMNRVVEIACGGSSSHCLRADGRVWSWGASALGDGTTNSHSTPVLTGQQINFGDVIAISAQGFHCMALKRDGTVYAWGYNGFGQIGIGSFVDQLLPVPVHTPTDDGLLTDIVAISGGGGHSLALSAVGVLYAWGDNTNGQLGINSGVYGRRKIPTATEWPSGSDSFGSPYALAAGFGHSLAIRANGVVQLKVTVQGMLCFGPSLRFEFRPVEGGSAIVRTRTIGTGGLFVFHDIPAGTYNIAVKGQKTLQAIMAQEIWTQNGAKIC